MVSGGQMRVRLIKVDRPQTCLFCETKTIFLIAGKTIKPLCAQCWSDLAEILDNVVGHLFEPDTKSCGIDSGGSKC